MSDDKLGINVSCTWGEGPDVLVMIEGKPLICHEHPKNNPPPAGQWTHGFITKGSMDLTRNEALDLAQQLFSAASACRDLEKSYADYVEHDMAIHNAEVENMNHEKTQTSQQQGDKANKTREAARPVIKDVLQDLRTGRL